VLLLRKYCEINQSQLEIVTNAITIFLDNPHFSNREVARQIGVSEGIIRYWKKQSYWKELENKIKRERVEALKFMTKNQEEYIKKLERRIATLEKFEGGVEATAARLLKTANDSLLELSKNKSPTKACSEAVKNGTVIVSEKGIKAVESVTRLYKDLYEFDLILNFLREDDGDEEE